MNYSTHNPQKIPTVADFFAQPTEPDDVEEPGQWIPGREQFNAPADAWEPGPLVFVPQDPMDRIADSLGRLADHFDSTQTFTGELATTTSASDGWISPADAGVLEGQLRGAEELIADLRADRAELAEVVEQIDAALSKSKAAPALAAKAVIEAWRKGPAEPEAELTDTDRFLAGESLNPSGAPYVPEEDAAAEAIDTAYDGITGTEGLENALATYPPGGLDPVVHESDVSQIGDEQPDAPSAMLVAIEPPAHDASVTDWRSYARRVHGIPAGEASVFDTMNRSQVRTALGIGQPVEGGA